MLTKSEKYEEHIFFLTLSCLAVPVFCFHKNIKGKDQVAVENSRETWFSKLPRVSDGALPEAVSLTLFGSVQLSGEIKHRV